MKKIINRTEDVVIEMCKGIVEAHPELALNEKYKVIQKRELDQDKVTLISGGGSGHEPAHAGFIGEGMLDVAVCGDVFASPSQIQVYQALRETSSNKGSLLIIKNYSGDIMNFKNAAHLATEDGIQVDYVKVDDDIAVQDSLYTVGRRGVAGTVFVHKIAGAAAKRGMDLAGVKEATQKAAENVKSIGFALTSCTVPASGKPTFKIAEGEMEYGVGIHGEPGIRREEVISADDLAERMTDSLLEELDVDSGDELAVLVNGFGGSPIQELYLFNHSVMKALAKREVKVAKILVGNYMTSIDMAGASLSILKLDEGLKDLLNESCDTPALKVKGPSQYSYYVEDNKDEKKTQPQFTVETDESFSIIENEEISLNNMIYMVDSMSACIIENEVPFCELDSHAGDGDFGMSIAKGFKQLKREWKDILAHKELDIGKFLDQSSLVIMEHCGGASGPIWGSAFRAAAKSAEGKQKLTAKEFADLLQSTVTGIQSVGERSFGRGAVVGDKTLIDALVPCADLWTEKAGKENILTLMKEGAKAAVDGAKATEAIAARMGRAGTVGDRSIGHPDAGAHGLGVIFTYVADSMKE